MSATTHALTPFDAAVLQVLAALDPAALAHNAQANKQADRLAPFLAEVAAAQQRMDQAKTEAAVNLARGDHNEALHTLAGARRSLGLAA
jgi:hypothetical protein